MKNNKQTVQKFKVFDANGRILGRLAVEIAKFLSGKDEVDFAPNLLPNHWAVVINSDKVRLSAEKGKKKIYYWHSGYPGGIYSATFDEMMDKDSTKVIEKAVKGMLPSNKLMQKALTRLRVFKTDKHDYEGQIKKDEAK